jgi:hypothetical protein
MYGVHFDHGALIVRFPPYRHCLQRTGSRGEVGAEAPFDKVNSYMTR